MTKNRRSVIEPPDSAGRVRIVLLPPSHDAIEQREWAALRRCSRDVLQLAHHIESKASPEADEGWGHRQYPPQPALEALTAATMLSSVVERLRGKLVGWHCAMALPGPRSAAL
jgi:hypothetical protein